MKYISMINQKFKSEISSDLIFTLSEAAKSIPSEEKDDFISGLESLDSDPESLKMYLRGYNMHKLGMDPSVDLLSLISRFSLFLLKVRESDEDVNSYFHIVDILVNKVGISYADICLYFDAQASDLDGNSPIEEFFCNGFGRILNIIDDYDSDMNEDVVYH